MDFSRHVSLEFKPSEALFSSSMSSSCFVERRFDSIAWGCSTSTGRPEVIIQGSIEGEIQSHSDINVQVNIKGFIQVNIQDTWKHPLLRNMLFSCFPSLTHYPTFVCTIVRSESSCNEVAFFIHLAFWRIWNKSQSCFDHRFHSGSCKLTNQWKRQTSSFRTSKCIEMTTFRRESSRGGIHPPAPWGSTT